MLVPVVRHHRWSKVDLCEYIWVKRPQDENPAMPLSSVEAFANASLNNAAME